MGDPKEGADPPLQTEKKIITCSKSRNNLKTTKQTALETLQSILFIKTAKEESG